MLTAIKVIVGVTAVSFIGCVAYIQITTILSNCGYPIIGKLPTTSLLFLSLACLLAICKILGPPLFLALVSQRRWVSAVALILCALTLAVPSAIFSVDALGEPTITKLVIAVSADFIPLFGLTAVMKSAAEAEAPPNHFKDTAHMAAAAPPAPRQSFTASVAPEMRVREFLEARIEQSVGSAIEARAFYDSFQDYAARAGWAPLTQKALGTALRRLGVAKDRKGKHGCVRYLNLELRGLTTELADERAQ